MTSFALRLFAIITMLIDHTAAVLVPMDSPFYLPMRTVGRLAFPVFCFLVVEGLAHTRSATKYLARMAAFAIISEVPFDLAIHPAEAAAGNGFFEFSGQNVFFTLFLGLAAITTAEKLGGLILSNLAKNNSASRIAHAAFLKMLVVLPIPAALIWCGDLLATDYNSFGVMLICAIYILRVEPPILRKPLAPAGILGMLALFFWGNLEIYAGFSALPIALYNGKPGPRKLKLFFYVFYPAHLLALAIIRMCIT